MINAKKYIGVKYGRLTVLNLFRKNGRTISECICDCGNVKTFVFDNVKRGLTTSCKCYNKEVVTKHGMHGTKAYAAWQHMIRRCEASNANFRHIYYDKGVRVCKRWFVFSKFLQDMGEPPSTAHSLDRVNGNRGYFKSNCRWATKTEQSRNTSRNRIIEYNGERKCASEWAELYNIKYQVLLKRLKLGWPMKQALTEPINEAYQRFKS